MNRRAFLSLSAASALRATDHGPRTTVVIFSKHLHFLKGEALARAAKDLGFDGIDLTVRPGGHVEPARADRDLPPLVETIRAHGLSVPMVTSGIVDADTPHAQRVLETLAGLGIPDYRWGGFLYDARPAFDQLRDLRPRVAKLAELNARHKLRALYHTHSGVNQVGASIWDLCILLKDFDPAQVAVNYDVCHATIEGGLGGWLSSFSATGPYLGGIAVKDFVWARDAQGRWDVSWRPLGQGMVRLHEFFKLLKQRTFTGPLQIHYEYPLGGAEHGSDHLTLPQDQVFSSLRRDLALVRRLLASG